MSIKESRGRTENEEKWEKKWKDGATWAVRVDRHAERMRNEGR